MWLIGGVLLQNAAGLFVLVGVVNIFGGIVVLDDLVFHDAHAGLFHGGFGKRNPGPVGGSGGSQEDPVHLLLGVGGVFLLGGTDPGDGSIQLRNIGNGGVMVCHTNHLSGV